MADRPEESPGFLLWHATLRWQRGIVAALRPLDLTHVQFVLLASLWWLDSHGTTRPNQLELARLAGTDVKMTSQVLARLEEKGLLTREVDARDTRAKRLRITEAGVRLAVEAVKVAEVVDREFFAPVSDRRALLTMLQRLGGSGSPTAT